MAETPLIAGSSEPASARSPCTISAPKILGDSLCCLSNGIILKWIMTGGEFDITEENRLLFEALFL